MFCPKCGSKTLVLKNTRHNEKDNEVYRRRVCSYKGCGHRFYTVEFTVDDNENFKTNWNNAKTKKIGKVGRE